MAEKEYIEREALTKHLRGACVAKYPASFTFGIISAAEEVEKMPAADVVEVVRCRDCVWWEARTCGACVGKCQNPINGLVSEYCDDEDYCSYGERREQG